MVVMVGGKVVPNGSNYDTLITTTGGPGFMSEEKEEVDSVADVEAEVVDDEGDKDDEFSNYIQNLSNYIQEGEGTPLAHAKTDPPAGYSPQATNSPAVAIAKEAVAAAVANIGGDDDDEDDGGGKPVAESFEPTGIKPVGDQAIDPSKRRSTLGDKDAKWLAMVDKLKEFKRVNGHCNVPYHRPPLLTHLMSWCHSQRRLYRTGKMQPIRIQTLEEVGFQWNSKRGKGRPGGAQLKQLTWEERLEQLKGYKEKYGTFEVNPHTYDEREMQLNQWIFTQRQNYHEAKLAADRIERMDAINFDWKEPLPVKIKKEKAPGTETNDNKKRPGTSPIGSPPAKRARMTAARTPVAVVVPPPAPSPPPPDEDEWVEMFEKLQKLKRKNKTLPTSFPQDKAMDRWVRHQKLLIRKEDLHRSRMERLHRLGFELPPGITLATYQKKQMAAKSAATAAKAAAAAKKSPPQKKSPAAAAQAKKTPAKFVPPRVIPGAPPQGAFPPGAFPPGAFPPGMFNPFMPHFPYGPPPHMPPYAMAQVHQPAGAKKSPANAKAKTPPNHNSAQTAAMQSQNEFIKINAKLRAENEQLQAMHNSMMTSLEEEKMVRRQGHQELQRKIETQEQKITIQGSTIKKQGQQIKELMDQMKDVIARHKEEVRVQEEKAREELRRHQEEQIRQAEAQRQRDMQELQRQQEEQELLEQQRRQQEEARRQQDLFVLRQHGLFH